MIYESGDSLKQLKNELHINEDSVNYKEVKIVCSTANNNNFEADCKLFLESLITSFGARFENLQNHELFGKLDVLDPCNTANLSETENENINEKFKKIVSALLDIIVIYQKTIMEEYEYYKLWAKNK